MRPRLRARFRHAPGLQVPEEDAGGGFGPSRQKFVAFLFDLVSDAVDEVFRCETEPQNPAWLPPKPLEKERRALPKSESELLARVAKEIGVALNFEKRAAKENLVVRSATVKSARKTLRC
jgi:hypothetical protein